MAIDPKQVQALFLEVIQGDMVERSAILDRVCGEDAELRRRIEVLLRAHDDSGELPPVAAEGTGPYEPSPSHMGTDLQPGKMFAGRYKLREKLGEGGMGIVWVADQTEPVLRRVALKVIKSADDSRRLLARFDQERQALALMDHPNIAKVFDAGVSAEGRPYFVMELIKGVPLTKYCDEARLTPRQRLELFGPVCQAVQHAHQKGIIHRDLKPNNILIGLYDGRPVPKVIDFGVAKATGRHLTEESIYTEVGVMIGTLEYMSPEQAELNNLDIDTRSDIYALGVILYELLTGSVPFSRQEMKAAGFAEMLRIIKEVEPPKPSTRLSGSGTLPTVAAQRHTEPTRLARLVRGELDWIVMKCLEKDRSRRYETANGLALDLQRYLADEPVAAGPPSVAYRLRKFIRRNKTQVVAASLVLLALLAGIVGTSWGLVEARSQRDAAEQARKAETERAEGERLAKEDAERQKARAEKGEKLADERRKQVEVEKTKAEQEKLVAQSVRYFLQNKLLCQADVTQQANALLDSGFAAEVKENPTILELLDRAAKELTADKIEAIFPNQPLVQAGILQTVGSTYHGVGEYERSIGFLQRSLALYRHHLGTNHPDTLSGMNNLAAAYRVADKLDLALPLLEETLKLQKANLGPDQPLTLITMGNLATGYQEANQLDLALPLLEETLKLAQAKLGPHDPITLSSMNNLASGYLDTGKLDLALPLFVRTLNLRKAKLGPNHPATLSTMSKLAEAYRVAGKLDLALPLIEETLKVQKAKLGTDHPNTLGSMNNLALTYLNSGKLALAIPLFEETLKLRKAKVGPERRETLASMNNLALAYLNSGKLALAIPLFEETLKLQKAILGPEHPDTLQSMHNLAAAYQAAGKLNLTLPLFEETLKFRKAKLGPEDSNTLNSMNSLAGAYQAAGKLDLALPLFEETLKLRKAKLSPNHPDTLSSMNNLATAYWQAKQLDKSVALFEETLKRREAELGRDHPNTLLTVANLGVNYKDTGRLAEAIPLLEEAHRATKKHPGLGWVLNPLLDAYAKAGETAKLANLLLDQLLEARKTLPKDSPQLTTLLAQVGMALLLQNKGAEAEPHLRECLAISEKKQPDLWLTFNTKSMLGAALLGQKKYGEAEPPLLAGYEGMKKQEAMIPPQGKVHLTEAVERLVQLYEAIGKKDKAAKWRKELESIKASQKKPEKQP